MAFTKRPIGMNFNSKTKLVTKVDDRYQAAKLGVQEKWIIRKIAGRTLEGDAEFANDFKALVSFFGRLSKSLPLDMVGHASSKYDEFGVERAHTK